MRELSCFGNSSVGIAAAVWPRRRAGSLAVGGNHGGVRCLAALREGAPHPGHRCAGATGLAVAFDDALLPSSRRAYHVLHKKRGSRSLATAADTAVGVH
uniref:Uncharacterized protein n=1 Tax=Oryza rufipogon TaxID=4529 RepID=A0A0E0R976_ORYRU